MSEKTSDAQRHRIRDAVADGKSRLQVAKEEGVSYSTVKKYTADLDGDQRERLSERAQEMLKALMDDGYYNDTNKPGVRSAYVTLREKGFPVRRAEVARRIIYFWEEKKQEAMRKHIENMQSNTISYQDLGRMANAFGIDASPREFLGRISEMNGVERERSDSKNEALSEWLDDSSDSLVESCIP